jgi:hypothetical protein
MKRTAITIARPKSLQVRLTDVRDAGYVTVNAFHFDLRVGAAETLTPALQEGVNVLSFVVTTTRFREKVLNLALDRPQWQGRFELYLNGSLISAFEDQGAALLGGGVYRIAQLDLTIFTPTAEPEANELVERLRRVAGMTDTAPTDLERAHQHTRFRNQVALRTWKNRFGVDFVYVSDAAGTCVYAGYVGWAHARALRSELAAIREEYRAALA